MPATARERTVLPPREEGELGELIQLFERMDTGPATPTLTGPDGKTLPLPPEVYEVLREVVGSMSRGEAVTVVPVHLRLTTQEAADLLGISRPTFVKLLEAGEIPYEQPGRHRRVLLSDVLAYREDRSTRRRAALDRMVEIAEEAGMYEEADWPAKTR